MRHENQSNLMKAVSETDFTKPLLFRYQGVTTVPKGGLVA